MPSVPAEAVYATLRELAGDAGECAPTVGELAELAELGTTRAREALRELERAGLIERRASSGRAPAGYVLNPTRNPTREPVQPNAQPNARAPRVGLDQPNALAGERDRSEPSLRARSAGNGNRSRAAAPAPAPARARLAAQPNAQEHPMADPEPEPANPAGEAIAAAVAECTRQGKPELDNAAKKRIGSVAKRMHREGVTISDLQAAAMYLAAHGMSDLQAAYRAHLEATQVETAGGELAERAAASARSRTKGDPWHPITLAELAEVWHAMQVNWRRVPLPPECDADTWVGELRPCPVDAVLSAVRQWSRRTDGQGNWPPTVGQLRTVSRKLYGDELTYQAGRKAVAEQQAILRGEAKGDGSDPRAAGA